MEADGERFWLACDGDRPVGFGAGLVRGAFSYCAGLFVLPEWQGRGLGRRLFETALEGLPVAGGVTALTSNAANPISNGLYARHGIYPQHALLVLSGSAAAVGRLAAGEGARTRPRSPSRRRTSTSCARSTTRSSASTAPPTISGSCSRPRPPRLAASPARPGRRLRLPRRRLHRGPGSVGPIATLRPGDQAAALRFVIAELAARGQERATVVVPGPNLAAQRLLWGAGFAFEGATGLVCASRPFARFDRYVLAGDSIM